jgi:hypothetical protein
LIGRIPFSEHDYGISGLPGFFLQDGFPFRSQPFKPYKPVTLETFCLNQDSQDFRISRIFYAGEYLKADIQHFQAVAFESSLQS